MSVEIKVPSPGESITEVQIARWLKADGDYVYREEEIAEIDSDKATLTIAAEADGQLKILAKEGETIPVGSVICTIDTHAKVPEKKPLPKQEPAKAQATQPKAAAVATPKVQATPLAAKLMQENKLEPSQVKPAKGSRRITKNDVLKMIEQPAEKSRNERREKMTMLRKKVSERLVAVKQQTAMLTTFNEVDMLPITELRKKYKDAFKEKHGVGLGFMSFFTKAVCIALEKFPAVNARIEGDEIVYHDYCDIGIAVSAPKGLMVPVIRNAENLTLAETEEQVMNLASRARDGKITIEEMTGGTFTITNGGVFGSMLSTPIINPPQSAILGMHNIVERPVAVSSQVVIRPVMYVALSYDHRIIDGRESVGFLVTVKQLLENPVKMLLQGNDPEKLLLGL
ncbi:MAG: 2-oxoglutarate dehydrogenase complex dihydrolipoyllysine-residue succinyltransferase [Bacteroidia bacterium]|nr:2-oxoglutarate dehydrogenase complex dihydrolipoyllysine-residue succinyltransferase [Bacteroidia bacterium]